MSYPIVNLLERLEADLCFGLTCGQTVSLFWKMILKAPIKSLGYANREQWVFPRVTGLIAWRSGTKLYCIMMKNVFHSFCGKSLISVWIGFLLGKNDFFFVFLFFFEMHVNLADTYYVYIVTSLCGSLMCSKETQRTVGGPGFRNSLDYLHPIHFPEMSDPDLGKALVWNF